MASPAGSGVQPRNAAPTQSINAEIAKAIVNFMNRAYAVAPVQGSSALVCPRVWLCSRSSDLIFPGEPLPRRLLRHPKGSANLGPCAALFPGILDGLADQLVDCPGSTRCNPEVLERLLPPRSCQSKTTLRRPRMDPD